MSKYISYKNNVVDALEALADKELQKVLWFPNDKGLMYSYTDSISDLFDDCSLEEAIYDHGVILYSKLADEALRQLETEIRKLNAYDYSEEALIELPHMEIIREKAAYALKLVLACDGSESTEKIIM